VPTTTCGRSSSIPCHTKGALHLDDALIRRTRVSIETRDGGVAAATEVSELMGRVSGWDDDDRTREVAHYLGRVEAERESQTMPDDHTAYAARMGAPYVRTGGR
jgi:glycerol-3-phosphate dehydrogenase